MKHQVLTIEQISLLKEKTSLIINQDNASMVWLKNGQLVYNEGQPIGEHDTLTLNLIDILNLLPKTIEILHYGYDDTYKLMIDFRNNEIYYLNTACQDDIDEGFGGETIIEAAFKLLVQMNKFNE